MPPMRKALSPARGVPSSRPIGRLRIRWLQSALVELGLYVGDPTGAWDERTGTGVRTLQLTRSLEPDGAEIEFEIAVRE